jgi:hypothetical protein
MIMTTNFFKGKTPSESKIKINELFLKMIKQNYK